jgi:carboxypeptidase D
MTRSTAPADHSPAVYYEFRHHNYTEMEKLLNKIAEAYPKITRLYSIGRSVQSRELYVSLR